MMIRELAVNRETSASEVLTAMHAISGELLYGKDPRAAPVTDLQTGILYLSSYSDLMAVQPTGREIVWQRPGNYILPPVVADGLV